MKVAYIYMGTKGVSYDALGMAIGLSHFAQVQCVISTNIDNLGLWEKEALVNSNFSLLKVNVANTVSAGIMGLFNIPRFMGIKKAIDSFSPDFVYSFMGHPWERMFVPYLKCKNVLTSIHDAVADHGDKDWRRKFMNLFNYRPRWYVTYSQNTKNGLAERGFDKDGIVVTHLACNLVLEDMPKESDVHHYNRFLFWGRIEPYKGLSVLLDAVGDVVKDHPQAKLIIAGRGSMDEYQEKLKGLVQNVEVHNDWIPNESIKDYFNQVDFVVAPYTAASQSGVITLAYSFGKPVVASDSGALPEQVVDGKTGIVVPAGDAAKLADAISYLLDNDAELSSMKKNAFDYSKELTWDAAAKIIIEFLVEKGKLRQG